MVNIKINILRCTVSKISKFVVDGYLFSHYFTVFVRRMRWTWHVARMGERRGEYRVLVGKPDGKRPFGRPRRRWENHIKMVLQEVDCQVVEWIELAWDKHRCRALVNAAMNLRVP